MPTARLVMYLDDGLICGGTERVARRLLEHWVGEGWQVFLVARRPPNDSFFSLPPGVQGLVLREPGAVGNQSDNGADGWRRRLGAVPGLVSLRSLARLGYEAGRLRQVLRRVDPDMAVALLTPANVKLVLAARGLRCGVVVSERNDTRSYKYPRMWLVLRRLFYRYGDVVTANLAASVEDMARYVPRARLVHVPNPLVCPAEDAVAAPRSSRRILSVGRLVHYKRHRMLIDVFAELADELDGWELDIVGDGPLRTELEQQIVGCGLVRRVHLHGQRHDVDAFYSAGAIFVLPSMVEGTPNALLEAMAHALPCIVSDSVTGAAAYIEESASGYVFRHDSAADLADRIRRLVRDPEHREGMGARAREMILAKAQESAYATWDRVIGLAQAAGARRYPAS